MPKSAGRNAPLSLDPALISRFRTALDRAGYAVEPVKSAVGAVGDALTPRAFQVPLIARRLDDGPLATLIRLFLLGSPAPLARAAAALEPLTLAEAAALGVVVVGRSRVHGTMRLIPGAEHIFACDRENEASADIAADHVMGITPSSRRLAELTIRRPVELALDLGTGCGYQAVLAASHAERVIATDVNPRALNVTAFNALLNGVGNVECRVGDRFAPVEGLRFDLIVSNPPFVISPERSITYRDSGLGADRVSSDIVAAASGYLREGGLAHVLISWLHASSGDWSAPLRTWVAGSGCDAWFIREASYDPLAYAATWNQALAGDVARYATTVERWSRYFEELRAEAIGYGAAILRRREGDPRVRTDDLTTSPAPGVSDELAALWGAGDRLAGLDDAALEAEILTLAPEHRLEQTLHCRDGTFEVLGASLALDRGLRPRAEIDVAIAQLLALLDGRRPLREALQGAAAALGSPLDGPAGVRTEALPAVRDLVRLGFLRFATPTV